MIYAQYTEVLYNLLKNEQTKPLIEKAMSTYPLYKSTSEQEYGIPNIVPTREELNNKILNYYKYREIGFETVGRFLDELETALIEIMPYYNQLYFSADQDYNIIYNVDYKRTISRNKDGKTSNTSNSTADRNGTTSNNGTSQATSEGTDRNTTTTNNSSQVQDQTTTSASVENYNKNIKSDTPQGQLSITNRQIDNVDYANEASWNHDSNSENGTSSGTSTSSGNSTTTLNGSSNSTNNVTNESSGTNKETEKINGTENGTSNEKEDTLETTKGNFGVVSAQDLIAKYREIIINIDQQIINDPRIKELFMLVY